MRIRSALHATIGTLRSPAASGAPRGFTLVELLLAVVILLIVILAVGRIFSTTSTVTAFAEANADILQEAVAIEQQIRRDLASISREGFLAIQNIEVRNDVNGADVLLDPTRPADQVFRLDRMMFLADGFVSTSRFVGHQEPVPLPNENMQSPRGTNPQAAVSRIYYGHGVQFPTARPLTDPGFFEDEQPLAPWSRSNPFDQSTWLGMTRWPTGQAQPAIVATPLPPAEWALVRQPVLLAEARGSSPNYPLFVASRTRNAAASIWPLFVGGPADRGSIRKGRVDIATQTPAAIRRLITNDLASPDLPQNIASTGATVPFPSNPDDDYDPVRPWTGFNNGQRMIARTFAYPRVEKKPPSSRRDDQMLASGLLGSNVSSFIVEWTYADGAGAQVARTDERSFIERQRCNLDVCGNVNTNCLPAEPWFLAGVDLESVGSNANLADPANWRCMQGVVVDRVRPERWFGLRPRSIQTAQQAIDNPQATIDFTLYGTIFPTLPIYPQNIEGTLPTDVPQVGPPNAPRVRTYQATFGYNRDRAFEVVGPGPAGRRMSQALAYTPLPTAIRITMTLHDPRGTLAEGRTFQFIVPLGESR